MLDEARSVDDAPDEQMKSLKPRTRKFVIIANRLNKSSSRTYTHTSQIGKKKERRRKRTPKRKFIPSIIPIERHNEEPHALQPTSTAFQATTGPGEDYSALVATS
jgi:hypothetical protein